jgi:hypothetical protein
MVRRHRCASGGSGGSSRVSAWILNPAATAAANSNAITIQVMAGSLLALPAWRDPPLR